MDILLLHGYLRYEHGKKQKKVDADRRIGAPRISQTIALMLHRKEQLVKEVWADYLRNKPIIPDIIAGNRAAKRTVVLGCRYVINELREFVRDRRETRTRTVAKDVLEYFANRQFGQLDHSNKATMKVGLRAVQRFLISNGYKRGKKKGSQSYRLKAEIMLKLDNYVMRILQENKNNTTRRRVYMDESYIHPNNCRHDDSLYDPNDE
uniref:AlNc14C727G12452 protein n=1 Tax=Albugo laibachii Nc14 TaxID=890382 RepID=F0X1X4_9STRA|nr:AlNc14C727G12452 [Albugo laibachii Nc14]|eukprot:CCA27832.1 AlNc14C727G12452 [Albugo laibachii Nc14]